MIGGRNLGRGCINTPVGLNPFRQQRRRPSDYAMVVAALVVVVAAVVWALFGG